MTKTEKDLSTDVKQSNLSGLPNSFHRCETILIKGLPIPPSSNSQYKLFRRGNKTYHVPTDELIIFKELMERYPDKHPNEYQSHLKIMSDWLAKGLTLEFHATFFFSHKRVWTLKNTPKRMDVSNRIKALHDCVSSILNVDDCVFFRISAEKTVVKENEAESVSIEIHPIMRN